MRTIALSASIAPLDISQDFRFADSECEQFIHPRTPVWPDLGSWSIFKFPSGSTTLAVTGGALECQQRETTLRRLTGGALNSSHPRVDTADSDGVSAADSGRSSAVRKRRGRR